MSAAKECLDSHLSLVLERSNGGENRQKQPSIPVPKGSILEKSIAGLTDTGVAPSKVSFEEAMALCSRMEKAAK